MQPTPDFANHRERLLSRLGPDEAVLVFAASPKLRNSHTEYRYRPDSDLFWLTGWEDPGAAVWLRPGEGPFVLFVQPKDEDREVWDGFRHGPAGARRHFGADEAHEVSALADELTRLVQGVTTLHFAIGSDGDHDQIVLGAIAKATRAARINGLDVPETFVRPSRLLHELRLFKGDDELAVMRRSASFSADAHRAAMRATRPGVNEHAIEATLLGHFAANGSTGPGYTPIVAGGENACTLHYVRNRAPLRAGDLLLVDAGGEHHYYTADITRTWPVSGRFSPAQRQVYEIVLAAQLAAIDKCRVGASFRDVHDAAVRLLAQGMLDLELLEGDLDEIIATNAYKRYYMHGTSHWLGLDVHDVGSYGRAGVSRPLSPGMVLTVEPGLYLPNKPEVPEHLRGIGVRIEDDVLVTDGEPEVLTAAAPKTVGEIEAWMAANA